MKILIRRWSTNEMTSPDQIFVHTFFGNYACSKQAFTANFSNLLNWANLNLEINSLKSVRPLAEGQSLFRASSFHQ